MIELEEGGTAEMLDGQIFLTVENEASGEKIEFLTRTDLEEMIKLFKETE